MKKIEKKINKAFALVFKMKNFKNNKKLNIKNVKKWDSINHVELILVLESLFKIKIDPEISFTLDSYQSILNYLNKTVKK